MFDKITEIKKHETIINDNRFSVYNYCGVSIQSVLNKFFTKINACVEFTNKTLDLAEWLVNEGLSLEVSKKLQIWLEDGTLQQIINQEIFGNINAKLDEHDAFIQEIFSELENLSRQDIKILEKIGNIEGDITTIKGQITDINAEIEELKKIPKSELEVFEGLRPKSITQMIKEKKAWELENFPKNRIIAGTFNLPCTRNASIKGVTYAQYMLLENKVTICGMQEFAVLNSFNSKWWMLMPNVYDNIFSEPLGYLAEGGGTQSNALLSSLFMSGSTMVKYTNTPQGKHEGRGYVKTTITINGKKVSYYSTHMTHDNGALTTEQFRQLAQTLISDPNPYKVVSGDFNSKTMSDYNIILNNGYKLAYPQINQLDNIIVSDNINVISSKLVDTESFISDHKLLVAELELI